MYNIFYLLYILFLNIYIYIFILFTKLKRYKLKIINYIKINLNNMYILNLKSYNIYINNIIYI